jgi:hypothetical protein
MTTNTQPLSESGQFVRVTAAERVVPAPPATTGLVIRAIKVALIVGTGLTLINQSDALLGAAPAGALWWKIPLTYTMPFCVSLYSSIMSTRGRS